MIHNMYNVHMYICRSSAQTDDQLHAQLALVKQKRERERERYTYICIYIYILQVPWKQTPKPTAWGSWYSLVLPLRLCAAGGCDEAQGYVVQLL